MELALIAAVGKNRELGASNELLWHLPKDFSWFIKHTKNKPLIMGRKTMESLGKPLKNRLNIVLTRSGKAMDGFVVAANWDEAISIASNWIDEHNNTSHNLHPVNAATLHELSGMNLEMTGNSEAGALDTNSSAPKEYGVVANEIMVIGGGEIYAQAMGRVSRMYLTEVEASFPNADTYFPEFSAPWEAVYRESVPSDEKHAFEFQFVVYETVSKE